MLTAKKVISWGWSMVLGRAGEWQVYLALEADEGMKEAIQEKIDEWDKYVAMTEEVFYGECNKLKIRLSGVLITEKNEVLAVSKGGSVLLQREGRMGKLVMSSKKEMEVKKGKVKEGDELLLIAGAKEQSMMTIEMQMVDWDKMVVMATEEELG